MPLREPLGGLDPDQMSPREALEALYRLKQAIFLKVSGLQTRWRDG